MAKYTIEVSSSAEKQLKKIQKKIQSKIITAISALANDPYPTGVKKLVGTDNTYRIRIGDYRIIYDVEHKKLIIIILKIGHRKEIYR